MVMLTFKTIIARTGVTTHPKEEPGSGKTNEKAPTIKTKCNKWSESFTNVHVYGKCREYVGAHDLMIRVHEHGSDSRFWVFHHRSGSVNGVHRYGNAYARVRLLRVHANGRALP